MSRKSRNTKESKASSGERTDSMKWWFSQKEPGKLCVSKTNGHLVSDGKEVMSIMPSSSKSDTLKVLFRGNEKGYAFNISFFDFTRNKESRSFEPFVKSTERFAEHVEEFLSEERKRKNSSSSESAFEVPEPLKDFNTFSTFDDSSLATGSGEGSESVMGSQVDPSNISMVSTGERPEKRPAPKEIPEVDPLPAKVTRQKRVEKQGSVQESSDKDFLHAVKEHNLIREVPFNVKLASLVPPRNEFLVRPLNMMFVNQLKVEILERCSTFVKPLIAIVTGVSRREEFSERKLESEEYTLEVIGGNHRREAFLQLAQEEKLDNNSFTVQLFTEMSQKQALRLAQLHNREDSFHHELTTTDKVKLCRNLLHTQFGNKKCEGWRSLCAVIIGETETMISNVLFVASELDESVYDALLQLMQQYGALKLKGQKASKKALKENAKDSAFQVSFPYSKLKCLRGDLKSEELLRILQNVNSGDVTLQEMEKELCRLKEMRTLQNYFVRNTNCSSWREAKEKYPECTSEDVFQAFRGDIVRGTAKPRFLAFVQRAVALGGKTSEAEHRSQVTLLELDCLELSASKIPVELDSFKGADLVFVDIPKLWGVEDLTKFLRMAKSLNYGNNVEETRFVLFPVQSTEAVMLGQLQMAVKALQRVSLQYSLAYYQKSLEINTDTCKLNNIVLPFVVCCGTPNNAITNVFVVENESIFKEKDCGTIYKRQKPYKLYEELILNFSKDKSLHILDCCSGAGSCALACHKLGRKCFVFEKCPIKARLIRQRVM